MQDEPVVISQKVPRPTLWLDTFVLIKLTKLSRGEKLQGKDRERLQRLQDLLPALVMQGRLLCPQADQEDEYENGRLAREIDAEWAKLSFGVRMDHRAGIQDAQTELAMRAYCEQRTEIVIPWNAYFRSDPFEKIELARKIGGVVVVKFHMNDEYIQHKETAKIQTQTCWENIRQRNLADGITYDAWLPEELKGHAYAVPKFLKRHEERKRSGIKNIWTEAEIEGTFQSLALWDKLGGQPKGAEGLVQCMSSPYYTGMPACKINAQLACDLVTGNQRIRSGDSMDVQMLSVGIPVCHYVLCDNAMRDRIRRRGIDKEWSTKVYSMSTIEDLFSELDGLA